MSRLSLDGFSEAQSIVLMVGVAVSGILSIIGAVFIFATAIFFKKTDKQYWRLVMGLIMIDLILAITMVRELSKSLPPPKQVSI